MQPLEIGHSAEPPRDDSLSEKLRREAEVVLGGTAAGVARAWDEALDNPGSTALKVGTAAVLGGGLAFMQSRAGLLRIFAQVGGGAFGVAFLKDVAGRLDVTTGAIADSWRSAEGLEHNKAVVAGTLGPFMLDMGLMSAGGLAGAGAGRYGARRWDAYRSELIRIPGLELGAPAGPGSTILAKRASEVARLYKTSASSIGRVEALVSGPQGFGGNRGTAFAVTGDGKLITARHVVDGAVDIAVFDRRGIPHRARVIESDAVSDLAVLQLQGRRSASAFKPLPLANSEILADPASVGSVFALGHPNGWHELFVAPGWVSPRQPRPHLQVRFQLRSMEGNSGGPIVNAAGETLAVLTKGSRSSTVEMMGPPSRHVTRLLESASKRQATAIAAPVETTVTGRQRIADSGRALADLEHMFGKGFLTDRDPAFFHSKVTRVNLSMGQGDLASLALRTQYRPAYRDVVVEPIALDGAKLAETVMWPGTNIRIDSARLTLKLDKGKAPAKMTTENDPLAVLKQAFNYRGARSYLGEL